MNNLNNLKPSGTQFDQFDRPKTIKDRLNESIVPLSSISEPVLKAESTIVSITDSLPNPEEKMTRTEQAMRFNSGKTQWSLVDFEALKPMVDVLDFGAKKYSRDNWRHGMPATEILESLLRHSFKLLNGELVDEESHCEHIGHILCNAMFLSHVLKNKPEFNDLRGKEGKDESTLF